MGRVQTIGFRAPGIALPPPMAATGAGPHFTWQPISRASPTVLGAVSCTARPAPPARSAKIPRTGAGGNRSGRRAVRRDHLKDMGRFAEVEIHIAKGRDVEEPAVCGLTFDDPTHYVARRAKRLRS